MNSNPLASWMPSIVAFAIAFIVASVLSVLTYWLARRPGTAMRWMRIVFATVASLAMLMIVVLSFAAPEPLPVLVAVVVVVGASALQAAIERSIDGTSLSFKSQYTRSLLTYSSTSFIAYFMIGYATSWIARSGSTGSVWGWNFIAIGYGVLAGIVIAPVSISFFRWMFQTLPMRPGVDRLLHEEELAR